MSRKKRSAVGSKRRVAFVGGPEAGNVRSIPHDAKNLVTSGDWEYRIVGLSFQGDKRTLWFAYDSQRAPADLILELWDEYCPAAMIKRNAMPSSIIEKNKRRGT